MKSPGDEDGLLRVKGIYLGVIGLPSPLKPGTAESRESEDTTFFLKPTGEGLSLLREHFQGWKVIEMRIAVRDWFGSKGASDGYLVFLLYGFTFPVVLRRTKDQSRRKWIGPVVSSVVGDRRAMRDVLSIFKREAQVFDII